MNFETFRPFRKFCNFSFQIREKSLAEMKLWLATNADHIRVSSASLLASGTASEIVEEAEVASNLDLDKFLLRFLRAQKFDVKRAEAMMENYLRLRRQKPQWFQAAPDEQVGGHLCRE